MTEIGSPFLILAHGMSLGAVRALNRNPASFIALMSGTEEAWAHQTPLLVE